MLARVITSTLLLLGALPLLYLGIGAWQGQLGANPFEVLIRETGLWTLRFLILTLCITPLVLFTGKSTFFNRTVNFRKLLGLYAFFYGSLHLLSYLWFDQAFDWLEIVDDISQRPAILIGWIGFLLMLPLALTSNAISIHYLGQQRWKRLHLLIYPVILSGVVHFWWLASAKSDIQAPLIYGIIVIILLLLRHPRLTER